MKPRQNSKNFHTHSSNVPPSQQSAYSPFHHQNSANLASSVGAGGATALPHQQQQQHQPLPPPSALPLPPPLRNLDLTKLGLNLDDLSNLMQACNNPNVSSQEDIMKSLQALYGKGGAGNLQKLPPSSDWPMQSVSPPDFPRLGGSSGTSSGSTSVITSCNNTIASGGKSSFSNNINNGNNSSQLQRQEMHFNNAQHQATAAAAISRQFRAPTTSTPQLPLQQQQKSVLSLHQHLHQNESNNRRLNHQQNNLSATGSSSFANLNAASAAAAAAAAAPPSISSSSLELNANTSTLSSNLIGSCGKSSSNPYSSLSTGQAPPHHTNIMDTIGSSIDNMFYDNSLQQASTSSLINKDASTSFNQQHQQQQSLIRHHHQLQRLLKATGGQSKSPSPTTNHPNRNNDSQCQQRNSNSMSQIQRQLTSPLSAISPPQQTTLSSVPKSLLNLAACSSSPNSSSLHTGPRIPNVNQFNLTPSRQPTKNSSQASASGSGNIASINRSQLGGSLSVSNHELDQMSKRTGINREILRLYSGSSGSSNATNSSSRSNLKQPFTLLTEDQQISNNRINLRSLPSTSANSRATFNQTSRQPSDESLINQPQNNKEAFLASLQERVSKAGLSIGEVTKSSESISALPRDIPSSQCITTAANSSNIQQNNALSLSSGHSGEDLEERHDTKEIESAISRVEARNDLSLLYPPMLLASNSQRQINALSAGLQDVEDSELFTSEVKRIVSEECNIIYECKRCNNLFRSLANLVKHKRSFCTEQSFDKSTIDVSRRANANALAFLTDQQSAAIVQGSSDITSIDTDQGAFESESMNSASNKLENLAKSPPDGSASKSRILNSLKYNLRSSIINSAVRSDVIRALARSQRQQGGAPTNNTHTSLSKLLQSQPKSCLPPGRDSALKDALSMSCRSILNDRPSAGSDSRNDSSLNEINEHFIRNSTLAKSLLDQRVKSVDSNAVKVNSNFDPSMSKSDNLSQVVMQAARKQPKRKFLEDCIQRVKRDKLKTDDEPDLDNSDTANNTMTTNEREAMTAGESSFDDQKSRYIKDPLSIDDSDADSDLLTIDLEGPSKSSKSSQRSLLSRRPSRRASTNTSSTTSSTSSSKLNTSSALLKALTRPVDAKPCYPTSADVTPLETMEAKQAVGDKDPDDSKPSEDNEHQQEVSTEETQDNPDDEDNENAMIEVLSPLFDKYTCDICQNDHSDHANLMSHIMETHTDKKIVYPCLFCSFSFVSLENACRHLIDIHKKAKPQVHRLKDVVRSRSYMSDDFSACSDHLLVTDTTSRPSGREDDGQSKLETNEIDVVEPEVSAQSTQVTPTTESETKRSDPMSNAVTDNNSTHSFSASQAASSGSTSASARITPIYTDTEGEDVEDNDNDVVEKAEESAGQEGEEDGDHEEMALDVDKVESDGDDADHEDMGVGHEELDDNVDIDGGDVESVDDSSSIPSQDDNLEQISKSFKHPNAGKQIKMSRSRSVDDEDEDDLETNAEDLSEANTEEDEEEGEIEVEVDENEEGEEEEEEDNNDNDDEDNDEEDDDEDEEYEDDAKDKKTPTHNNNKQNPSQTTPSSSSAGSCGGSGGIMKLKIQLKTQPDEKSKVYRIV